MKSVIGKLGIAMVIAGALTSTATLATAAEIKAKLSGAQEVPPVKTMAAGTAHFTVKDDMSISGHVKTEGIKAIAAHIHDGSVGQNGPVAVPLTATSANEWSVPKDAKLTPAQMDKLKAGNLYVNVHSDAHKDGEIRAQLKE